MNPITRNDIWEALEKAEQDVTLKPEEFTIQMYLEAHPQSHSNRKKVYDLLEDMRLEGKLVKRYASFHGRSTAIYRPQGTKPIEGDPGWGVMVDG